MKNRLINLVFLFVIILLINIFFSGYGLCKEITITFASGMSGGPWFERAGIIAELIKEKDPNINVKVVPGAGLSNPSIVGANDAQIGFSYAPPIAWALTGTEMYKDKGQFPNIRTIASGWGMTMSNLIVSQSKGINSIDEIFANKMAINWGLPIKGSLDEYIVPKILSYYGVTYDDLIAWGGKLFYGGYADLVSYYADGQVDAIFSMPSHPVSWIIEMNSSKPIRILDYPQALVDYLIKEAFFEPAVVTAGTYSGNYTGPGKVRDLQSAGLEIVLLVNKDVPEEVVYSITKILFENSDKLKELVPQFENLNVETSWKNTGAPLHPGAEKYYKEVGAIK